MMFWRRLIWIVTLLPLAELLQHFGRRNPIASTMFDTEYIVNFDDLHYSYAYWIADRLVLVNS